MFNKKFNLYAFHKSHKFYKRYHAKLNKNEHNHSIHNSVCKKKIQFKINILKQ